MTTHKLLSILLIVFLLGGLTFGSIFSGAVVAQSPETPIETSDTSEDEEETTESSEEPPQISAGEQLGLAISKSNDELTTAIETRSFDRKLESSDNPDRDISEKIRSLENRLSTIQIRSENLKEKKADGTISETAYYIQKQRLDAQASQIQAELETVTQNVEEHNATIDTQKLTTLQTTAKKENSSGQDVAAIARTLGSPHPINKPETPSDSDSLEKSENRNNSHLENSKYSSEENTSTNKPDEETNDDDDDEEESENTDRRPDKSQKTDR